MARHNDFGVSAEDRAAHHLRAAGWQVLHRNWRWHRRELDIVARRGDVVAFVEVRARATTDFGHPAETISHRKRRDLNQAAHGWATCHGRPTDVYRFDVITIVGEAPPEHLEAAWRL
jgi:putative endonuclease